MEVQQQVPNACGRVFINLGTLYMILVIRLEDEVLLDFGNNFLCHSSLCHSFVTISDSSFGLRHIGLHGRKWHGFPACSEIVVTT